MPHKDGQKDGYSYDKGNYSTDKKKYSDNKMGHNPNDGENEMHFVGNSEGGRDEKAYDMKGVESGLASMETPEVKNAEYVTQNQRPEGMQHPASGRAGKFKIGT